MLAGVGAAWVLGLPFIWSATLLSDRIGLFDQWSAQRSCAAALLLAALPLVAGVAWAARTRHSVSNIDGSEPERGSGLDLTLRYVSNTTEQLLLFCLGCIAVTFLAPGTAPGLLPVLGCWFVIARAMFFIGYRINPLARAAGFAATFHPTVALLVYGLLRLFW